MRLRAWFGGLPITCKNYATHVFLHVFYMPRVFLHATCLIPFGPCTGAAYTEGCSFLLQCGIAMCVRPPHNSHTHTHTHTHIHTHTHTRTHTRTHIQTPLPTHPLLHQALHPLPHTETHTNTHTHTRRYTYMYTAHSTQTHTPSSTHLLLHQALQPLPLLFHTRCFCTAACFLSCCLRFQCFLQQFPKCKCVLRVGDKDVAVAKYDTRGRIC